jgi:signal transduction histidine kinase
MAFQQRDTSGKILARYEDLLRASVDWYWETDAAGRLLGLSQSVISSLGQAPYNLVGQDFLGLAEAAVDEEDSQDRAVTGTTEFASCLASRRAFRQLPLALLDAEGQAVSLLLSGVPYYTPDGRFAGFRGTAQRGNSDLQSRQTSETNKRLLRLLEAALNRKDELENERQAIIGTIDWTRIGAMAHELRTPLNAILGFAEIIRDRRFGEDAERYQEYAGLIHDSGRHLLEVVQNLLELADKERKNGNGESELIDPLKVASFVLIVLEEEAARGGIALVNRLPDTLPPIAGERRALRQILINLLTNGLKYTAPGGEVSLSAEIIADDTLHLLVRDSGIGIPADQLSKIFERHYRVPEAKDFEGGKGLGLAISRELARGLGGDITVESTPGRGSCFTLSLPLPQHGQPKDTSDKESDRAPAAAEKTTGAKPRKNRRSAAGKAPAKRAGRTS